MDRLILTDNKEGFGASDFEKADKLMGGEFHDYMLSRKDRDRKMFNFDEIVG